MNLTEVEYDRFADVELLLRGLTTLVKIRNNVRRVVSEELTGRLQVLRLSFSVLSLQLANCRAVCQATFLQSLLEVLDADSAFANYEQLVLLWVLWASASLNLDLQYR